MSHRGVDVDEVPLTRAILCEWPCPNVRLPGHTIVQRLTGHRLEHLLRGRDGQIVEHASVRGLEGKHNRPVQDGRGCRPAWIEPRRTELHRQANENNVAGSARDVAIPTSAGRSPED